MNPPRINIIDPAKKYGFKAKEKIVLRECIVEMYLGLHQHEKDAAQRVVISVEVEPSELFTDGGYWDYDPLHDFLKTEINGARIETQEELCHRIAAFILDGGGVSWLRVSSAKPDIFEDVGAVGYSLELAQE